MKNKKSPQRKYQIKNKSLGLCVTCGYPAINKTHCERHTFASNTYSTQKYLKKKYSRIEDRIKVIDLKIKKLRIVRKSLLVKI